MNELTVRSIRHQGQFVGQFRRIHKAGLRDGLREWRACPVPYGRRGEGSSMGSVGGIGAHLRTDEARRLHVGRQCEVGS